ncbi:4388_t:CDS:2, partial [Racocetra fulgida]
EAVHLCRSVSSGRKAVYPLAEEALNKWVVQLRQDVRQKLSHELSEQLDQFYEFIKKSQHINNYKLSYIANIDEMLIYFDMVGNLTVDYYLAKTVQIRTTDETLMNKWLDEIWKKRISTCEQK